MIRFEQVSKWYGQIAALLDVSFEIGAGVTGLVGHNGAGKSTIMHLCAGLTAPSQGSVVVAGGVPTDVPTRARIGLCPDLDAFYEHLSGRDFVVWMLRLHGFGAGEAKRRATAELERLGLGEAMHRKVGGYSKGMRQRVKLAQAVAHDPEVVLLDEPLTGLDPQARRELTDAIRGMGRDGRTVLVSSHVLHELEALADRVLLVHRGRLLAEGSVAALRDRIEDRPRRFRLRSPQPRVLARQLLEVGCVQRVEVVEGLGGREAVEVATSGTAGLFEAWTRIGAAGGGEADGGGAEILEIEPMDANLEAVFGYLAGGMVERGGSN